ncbi:MULTISPECIES: NAD-binding protein [Sulfurimonas]|uniref:NAD-binding protein n=1 Tax=Sulfurimonas diazotrophicus TaxID=3131939 RepID=A0ABZ3HC73_9BACT
MNVDAIILFGYNEFAREIAQQLRYSCSRIVIYALNNGDVEQAQAEGFEAHLADLEDNWDDLLSFDLSVTRIICALESEAENVFLTLSLRDRFHEAVIVALATTQENASKLRLAGANKVIAELQTTANLVIERLEKPVITRLLDALMDTQMELKVAQITLTELSPAVGKHINELLETTQRDIIVLAVVDQRMSESFIFTAKGYNHLLDPGDVLVVIGYDKEIKAFEEEVGGVRETDRSHRGG